MKIENTNTDNYVKEIHRDKRTYRFQYTLRLD